MVKPFLFEHEAGSTVLDTLESVDGGVWEAREERVAVVNARQNERERDEFGGSLLLPLLSSCNLIVASFVIKCSRNRKFEIYPETHNYFSKIK